MSYRKIAAGIIAAAGVAVIGLGVAYAAADDNDDETSEAFEFEVAEDATRFAFDDEPVFDDGMPGYGNPFVTQGYIYEAGHPRRRRRRQSRRQPDTPGGRDRHLDL